MAKRALVTGVTGQDGAYLAKLLLEKGYEVWGAHRRSASADFNRLNELGIGQDVKRIPFDLLEPMNIFRVLEKSRPDEVYNLAAQSFVALSFEQPTYTANADGLGVVRLLEAIRSANPAIRFFQASTSELFGNVPQSPQSETTPFQPRSPYGIAKLYAHSMTVNYRDSYGLHASSGILFNHESPLRGLEFVTRKITSTFALIRHGLRDYLELGNLDGKRDWGYAGDYVEGMWRMLQEDEAGDYVLATGEAHSVREFVALAAQAAGFQIEFEGEGERLVGIDRGSGRTILRTNPELYRPVEHSLLIGDPTRACTKLGWSPKVGFEQLVTMMVEADIDRVERGVLFV